MATEAAKKTIKSFMMALLESDDGMSWEELSDEILEARFKSLQLSLSNYNNVVQQNKELQTRLNTTTKSLNELKDKPFFPYLLNSGGMMDFGAFYLVSHAWFTIPNLQDQLGIVEVEWKDSGIRKMYLGAGKTRGKSFKEDVLSVAMYGQKIKDPSDGV